MILTLKIIAQQKSTVLEMIDVNEIKNFNITAGYPQKLEF